MQINSTKQILVLLFQTDNSSTILKWSQSNKKSKNVTTITEISIHFVTVKSTPSSLSLTHSPFASLSYTHTNHDSAVTKISTLRIGQPITGLAGYVSPTLVLILLVLPFPLLRCHQAACPFPFLVCHCQLLSLGREHTRSVSLRLDCQRDSCFFFVSLTRFVWWQIVLKWWKKKTMTGGGRGEREITQLELVLSPALTECVAVSFARDAISAWREWV